jgi:hypothetical protein
MHPIELKIMDFMKTVSSTVVDIEKFPLKPSAGDVEYFLRKIYEDDPARPFNIRMSNIGRPLCQLQMEQRNAPKIEDDWNLPLKFMYGAIIEGLTMSILRHSGVKIDAEQKPVLLYILGWDLEIKGTLDVIIDNKVYDIKSASSYSFKEKFSSYESLKEQDTFGYIPQLFGYSKAADKEPGGFIVVDKSSGDIKIVEVSSNWEEEQEASLKLIEDNVNILLSGAEFKRCFTDKDEKFKKKLTGNKVLASPCTYCKFRYECWPGLKHLPSQLSEAYDKPMKYYTRVNENTIL